MHSRDVYRRMIATVCVASCTLWAGCQGPNTRPVAQPIGTLSDPVWCQQESNAEASDFIFYDHEFQGNTAKLTPAAKKHLMGVAVRLPHVPFPVVIRRGAQFYGGAALRTESHGQSVATVPVQGWMAGCGAGWACCDSLSRVSAARSFRPRES